MLRRAVGKISAQNNCELCIVNCAFFTIFARFFIECAIYTLIIAHNPNF